MSTIVATSMGLPMRESTIREAKNSLAALIHVAEKGEAVRLTRHGKPVAVLVSEREYRRLSESSARRDPWAFLQRWRAQQGKDFSGIKDEEVDSWRDRSPEGGRKSSWGE
jgi:prevent-host-death family protein